MSEAGGNVRLHEYQERQAPSTKQQPERERKKVRTAAPTGHAVSRATRRPAVALGGLAQRSSRGLRKRTLGGSSLLYRPLSSAAALLLLLSAARRPTSHKPTTYAPVCLPGWLSNLAPHSLSHPLPDLPLLRTRRWAPRKNHPHSLAHTLAHSLFVWRRRSCVRIRASFVLWRSGTPRRDCIPGGSCHRSSLRD